MSALSITGESRSIQYFLPCLEGPVRVRLNADSKKAIHTSHSRLEQLLKKGIETGIHYKPIHTMSMYKLKNNLPITNNVGNTIVSLPMHPNLTENDIDKIISSANKFS